MLLCKVHFHRKSSPNLGGEMFRRRGFTMLLVALLMKGNLIFAEEQTAESMMKILGY